MDFVASQMLLALRWEKLPKFLDFLPVNKYWFSPLAGTGWLFPSNGRGRRPSPAWRVPGRLSDLQREGCAWRGASGEGGLKRHQLVLLETLQINGV